MTLYWERIIETAAILFTVDLLVFTLYQVVGDLPGAEPVPAWAWLLSPTLFTGYFAIWLRGRCP